MLKALKTSENHFSRYYLNEDFNDIYFDFALRDDIKIGSPFSVVVRMKNKSATKEYTVSINLRVNAVNYMGSVKDPVKQQKFDTTIAAGKVEEVRLDVSYDEYYGRLCDQCAFNISCLANVHDTNYEYFAQDDFRVRKPDIKIKIEGDGKTVEGEEFTASATLTNPLPIPLRKGMFKIEGPGLTSQLKIKVPETIAPEADTMVKFKITPKNTGRNTIVVKFESKELDDVDGFYVFMVEPKAELNGTSPKEAEGVVTNEV